MKLPSAEQYLEIVAKKSGNLGLLADHHFRLRNDNQYFYESGRNSIVFKTSRNSNFHAARFFLKDDPELFRRYHDVQHYLASKKLFWKVPFEFLDNGLYPVVLMEWVESLSLSEYIDSIISDTNALSELQFKLLELSGDLEENGIGHGNLNLQHIRITKEGNHTSLKLIDYDAMFVAPFRKKQSLSVGTPGFQHPMRLTSNYSETIDRFSFWVFLTALEAYKKSPHLWYEAAKHKYNKKEHILFDYRDFAFPNQSAIFQLLKGFNDEGLNFYTRKLFEFCSLSSPSSIEAPQIFGQHHKNDVKRGRESKRNREERMEDQMTSRKNIHPQVVALPTATHEPEVQPDEKTFARNNERLAHEKFREKENTLFAKKKKTVLWLIGTIIIAGGLMTAYLLKRDQPVPPKRTQDIQTKTVVTAKEINKSGPIFTSQEVNNFLSQLYLAYNKRDHQSILANYAPQLKQYYDADAVSREKLTGIIRDLFIKPDFYQCEPDFATLQFKEVGDNCIASITIKEIIQANPGSGNESYVSRIEYTIDRSYNIISEKNIN